jgi:hypothetical protein
MSIHLQIQEIALYTNSLTAQPQAGSKRVDSAAGETRDARPKYWHTTSRHQIKITVSKLQKNVPDQCIPYTHA